MVLKFCGIIVIFIYYYALCGIWVLWNYGICGIIEYWICGIGLVCGTVDLCE